MSRVPSPGHIAAWRALLRVHADVTEAAEASLRAAGAVPLRWYDALLCLYEAPGRRLRMGELARAALLSRSGLTRLVDRLEEAGLLRREADEADGRGAVAALTPAGLQALRRAWAAYGPALEEHFARHLRAAEAAHLAGLLGRVPRAGEAAGVVSRGTRAPPGGRR